jgi:hypothetical protein
VLGQKLARIILSMAEKQTFGYFLQKLTLKDQDLFDLYQKAQYQINEARHFTRGSPAIGPKVSADDMILDLLGEDALLPQSKEEKAQNGASRDEADTFAEQIEKFWLAGLQQMADDIVFQQYFNFPGNEFAAFVRELGLGFKRLRIDQEMENGLRLASRYANVEKIMALWKQVSLAANILNAYIDWLGFDPRVNDESRRTVALGSKSRVLFTPVPEPEALPELSEDPTAFERGYYMDWAAAFMRLVEDNVAFDGAIDFDPVQNLKLKNILQQLHI